jgi:hypothetical protein
MMRDDYLASVCIVDERGLDTILPLLVELETALSRCFRYFEIVYVLPEHSRSELNAHTKALTRLPNLRILIVDDGVSFYRRRALAASEAIGDVVALVDLADLRTGEMNAQIHAAKDDNSVLIGWRGSARVGGLTYRLLSLVSRHAVTPQASRTIILAREWLNAILAREHVSLDLRFEPRGGPVQYKRFTLNGHPAPKVRFKHRYELLTEILRSGASRYLKVYAVLGFAVTIGAALYGLYAIGVVLWRDDVQQGWFSNTFILAGSMGFISMGMSILAIALVAVLDRTTGGNDRMIVDEIANISFFDQMTDRNVEIGGGGVQYDLSGNR